LLSRAKQGRVSTISTPSGTSTKRDQCMSPPSGAFMRYCVMPPALPGHPVAESESGASGHRDRSTSKRQYSRDMNSTAHAANNQMPTISREKYRSAKIASSYRSHFAEKRYWCSA
jgi:hypothetical protein